MQTNRYLYFGLFFGQIVKLLKQFYDKFDIDTDSPAHTDEQWIFYANNQLQLRTNMQLIIIVKEIEFCLSGVSTRQTQVAALTIRIIAIDARAARIGISVVELLAARTTTIILVTSRTCRRAVTTVIKDRYIGFEYCSVGANIGNNENGFESSTDTFLATNNNGDVLSPHSIEVGVEFFEYAFDQRDENRIMFDILENENKNAIRFKVLMYFMFKYYHRYYANTV